MPDNVKLFLMGTALLAVTAHDFKTQIKLNDTEVKLRKTVSVCARLVRFQEHQIEYLTSKLDAAGVPITEFDRIAMGFDPNQ